MTPLPEPDFIEARTDPHRYKRPPKKRKAVAIETDAAMRAWLERAK